MRTITDFNDDWLFEGHTSVRLPHNAVDLPFSYFDERDYQRPFTCEKHFLADPAWEGREMTLRFDGAMANAVVRQDGVVIAVHADGYTPFSARLTGLTPGAHVIAVTVDGSENPDIPPFGGVIDYLTYAGIYRKVWLEVSAPVRIGRVKVETPDVLVDRKRLTARVWLHNPQDLPLAGRLRVDLLNGAGKVVASTEAEATADLTLGFDGLSGINLWSPESPALNTLALTLTTAQGSDTQATRFGFRQVAFTAQGFHLNGKPLKLRGLNRHQSFPCAGYALGRAAQERDAEIFLHDLRVNMVRTSHYPQSTHFLNRCDELGLLVFEEIPGWQHIGGTKWQDESV